MSERNGTPSAGTGTTEIPVVRPGDVEAPPADDEAAAPGAQPTAPVTVRPAPRGPRRGPLTRMGPWAPVAGATLGLLIGVVAVLLLAGSADTFEDRLALVFAVVGLGMLGASGTLLADEVGMLRHGVREAAVRPGRAETTVGLLHGMTPARVLLLVSAFVLFLAAFVAR